MLRIMQLLIIPLFLSACGNPGPLYLPKKSTKVAKNPTTQTQIVPKAKTLDKQKAKASAKTTP